MNVEHLHSSFFGPPLNVHIHRARNVSFVPFNIQTRNIWASSFSIFNQNQKRNKRVEFWQFGRGYVKFPMKKSMATWDHFRISSANDPSSKSSSLVRYLAPLWKEGLLIVRCSVFFAVLSASIMLVLYSQRQAKKFVEARLLPSVCSMLSQYLQRELDFGKVQGVSPLGITLQSCSIGPHHEEFSCGQFPRMKLRFRPFASLRRGTIVIDAVLIRPNILIAQKENFSWLGIPPSSDAHIKRHSSSEDGIDYRTRTRRLAREKASDRWYEGRGDAARKAAELGYFVPQESSDLSNTAESVDDPFMPLQSAGASSLFSMDDGKLWKDHHSVDMGMEYVLKHVELEKSFGINVPTKGFRFWPKIVPNPRKGKFKREGHRKMLEQDTVACKRRNLECSAAAALAYFKGLNNGGASADPAERSLSNGVFSAATCSKIDIPSSSNNRLENIEKNTNFVEAFDGDNFLKENPRFGVEQCEEMDDIGSPFSTKDNEDEGNCIDMQHRHALQDSFNSKTPYQFNSASDPMTRIKHELNRLMTPIQLSWVRHVFAKDSLLRTGHLDAFEQMGQHKQVQISETHDCSENIPDDSAERILGTSCGASECHTSKLQDGLPNKTERDVKVWDYVRFHPSNPRLILQYLYDLSGKLANHLVGQVQKLKSYMIVRAEYISSEFIEGMDLFHTNRRKMLPITLDSIYLTDGTLMLLAYGDREPREMDGVNGHVKFQNHYSRVHVQLSGNCREWRSDGAVRDGGLLSADVFVDIVDKKWHANLKVKNLFAPLFERILELPITWSKGSASGEVHICMSDGEIFPNIYGQLDVHDLSFCILEAPSCFSDITATLCFRGQRIFLHNSSGRFGDVPLEVSGDFGINPEEGEFHLMCQVPSVEVNRLMRTLKMKPLLFSLAGSVTAVFNCQGPLDAPLFVGSGIISRKTPHLASGFPPSPASESVNKNREAGAVAAFDHIPFSHVSANFTFNTDNCVADLYGMRATLVDGGEIRGAGNVWICPEGEIDDSAMDLNLSGNCIFERVVSHYLPNVSLMPLKIGELNGEAKLSGPLLKPRFDIRWGAPRALDSFSEARGDIIISHDYITVISSSVAFDLYMKVQTSYHQDIPENTNGTEYPKMVPLIIEGLDADLRLRGFDFSSIIFSNPFDAPKPIHLKAYGKMKFVGKVVKLDSVLDGSIVEGRKNLSTLTVKNLVGEVSLSGVKLNQLMVAPQLTGSLSFSRERVKLDAAGRPDESMSIEVVGPFWPIEDAISQNRPSFSISLQKGQLRANINYQPQNLANLEVRHLPLDELELASLRGMIQRAELQLNFQKRRGHGLLSVLHPKFSGVLGEALDVVARWSGDVITLEKAVLEQASSRYELQGEYVLPGTRDRYSYKESDRLLKNALDGNLGSIISSMGRWRIRLEVPGAEVSEMLPLARLLSRSIDPSVHSRSKDIFIANLQSMGFHAGSLRELLEAIQSRNNWSDEVSMEEISLPGLAELRGRWRGSLDASGGGDGDTLAEFNFHGEDWEWGSYITQRILAVGAYSNNNGLRLDNMFIQKDNATLHADGTVLGPNSNLHFAVLNFPIGFLPKVAQILESSTSESLNSFWQLLTPMKGILHMEGDLRGSLAKPECDVQVRLLDGAIGGIDLGRAEVVASVTSTSRFLFNANFEPVIQSGHVHIQGSVPVKHIQDDGLENDGNFKDSDRTLITSGWSKENLRGPNEDSEKKVVRDRAEDGWDTLLTESLKDLNWDVLDDGEVKIDADIKDGGMMLLTALYPYANWLHGYADINLQVRGTVEQPVFDGSASFHRASVSSPLLQRPLTNFGGTIHVKANRLYIISMESRVSRKGKMAIKGSLPLKTSESSSGDKIDMKCEVLEVQAKNIFSGQVDSHIQIAGSILQPNISGRIKLSHGEAYLPHDKGNGDAINRLASRKPSFPSSGFGRLASSGHVSRFFGLQPPPPNELPKHSAKRDEAEEAIDPVNSKPRLDVRLTDLRFFLGPELRIVYPLILNFAVSGGLELNGTAHPKLIRPKGVLTFENGDINLVATQVRLKRDHVNVAKFEPDVGLDPTLDLALVGSEWQFRIQSPASKWQDNLVVTSTRSVDQDVLSPSEAAKVFESQLAESLLERDGQLAFKKLATATLETLMPKIEGKGEFGQARWRLVYAPQIPSLLSVDPTIDPLKSLANNISFGTEVEVQLGKRLQASVVRQMKDSEMAVQWTLVYQLTSRLRVLFQSAPATRLLFEYSATSQD